MSHKQDAQDVTIVTRTSQDASSSKVVGKSTPLATSPEMRFTPWLNGLPMTEYESQEQRLHDEIIAYLRYVEPTPAEVEARRRVTEKISELVRCRFWTCEIKTFGSMAQNLYLPTGDSDLTVSTTQAYNDYSKKKGLFDLSRMLKEARMSNDAFVVTGAQVPILTFTTVDSIGSLKFDISINSDDGLRAIPIIKEYVATLPVLRPLILVLKSYLSSQKLNSAATGGLGSFALMCMVISFIQTNPHNRPKDYFEKPMEAESLGFLLMDFLQYYGREFPYQASYISVLQGGIFPKDAKGWVREAHPEALAIESPLDPEKDVARPCQKIGQIRAAFGAAYDALASVHSDAASGNILGSVLIMSDEVRGTACMILR